MFYNIVHEQGLVLQPTLQFSLQMAAWQAVNTLTIAERKLKPHTFEICSRETVDHVKVADDKPLWMLETTVEHGLPLDFRKDDSVY